MRPWIDQLRRSWLGALILGFGFLWSDIVCYTVGVIVGSVFEIALRKILARKAVSCIARSPAFQTAVTANFPMLA